MTARPMTGADLARARKAAGLNQTQLGKRIGCGRHAVSYWETKDRLPRRGWALDRMREALRDLGTLAWTIRKGGAGGWSVEVEDTPCRISSGRTTTRAGDGLSAPSAGCRVSAQYGGEAGAAIAPAREGEPVSAAALLAAGHLSAADREMLRVIVRMEAAQARKRRVPCGARTRKGHPCRNLSEPGRRRCKFHGGKPPGPRTAEGRARIAASMRERHRRKRAGQ